VINRPSSRFQALSCKLSARVFRGGVPVDAKVLGNGIGRFPLCSPLDDLLAEFYPEPRAADLCPWLARAMPAFVRSLIFWASTFAKDESRPSRIFRTNSLSVARCGSV
jgi:hypothetical protein